MNLTNELNSWSNLGKPLGENNSEVPNEFIFDYNHLCTVNKKHNFLVMCGKPEMIFI